MKVAGAVFGAIAPNTAIEDAALVPMLPMRWKALAPVQPGAESVTLLAAVPPFTHCTATTMASLGALACAVKVSTRTLLVLFDCWTKAFTCVAPVSTVNITGLLSAPPTVTITFPVVAAAGTVAVMLLELQEPMVAPAPLKVTVLEPWLPPKFAPAITMVEPAAPKLGDRFVITGDDPEGIAGLILTATSLNTPSVALKLTVSHAPALSFVFLYSLQSPAPSLAPRV